MRATVTALGAKNRRSQGPDLIPPWHVIMVVTC